MNTDNEQILGVKYCKLCNCATFSVFNINLNAVPICKKCSNAITMQTVDYLMHNESCAE